MTTKEVLRKETSLRKDFFIALLLFIFGTVIFIYLILTVISFMGQFVTTPVNSIQ